jgi:MoxR-like ATPase
MTEQTAAALALRAALTQARRGLVDRDVLVELVALAAVAGEHLLVIGPPGTAKSEAVRRVARSLEAKRFEYLLGRFTEPSELFGPVDLRKLRDGTVETRTQGMLPEAELAFLDEVFKGSTAILNTLLAVLNERVFRRGHQELRVPLRVCVGASNALPQDPSLAAFADRFVLRAYVQPIPDARLEDLLQAGWGADEALTPVASLADLDTLRAAARAMDPAPVRPLLARAVRELRAAGVELSDRRVVKLQKLVCAAAALDGRAQPSNRDLWPVVFAVPLQEDQQRARAVLGQVLEASSSAALSSAAEDAARGPAARADRMLRDGRELLEGDTPAPLRAEALLRELDAAFDDETRSPELTELRQRLRATLT